MPAASPLASNGKIKLAKKGEVDDKKMDVDDDDAVQAPLPKYMAIHQSPSVSEAIAVHDSDIPQPLKHALQLTFAMFSYVLKDPVRKGISTSALNPYITVLFTFLTIILRDKVAERVLSRVIPWEDLAAFCTRLPRRIMQSELQKDATFLSSLSHKIGVSEDEDGAARRSTNAASGHVTPMVRRRTSRHRSWTVRDQASLSME